MIWNRGATRNARFECLERKQLLAGDVIVGVVDGALSIQGDAADNAVVITAGAVAGSYVVTGLGGTNLLPIDPSTGLPGDPVSSVVVTDVDAGAKVELGDGNDTVAVLDASLSGKLEIHTGTGDDHVLVGAAGDIEADFGAALPDDLSVDLQGKLKISTGIGNDEVLVGDAAIHGRLAIDTGDGDDLLSLGGAAALDVKGAIGLELGAGNDELAMAQVDAKAAHVDAGVGDDTVNVDVTSASRLGIHTGDGDDSVQITDSVFASLGVKLGDGDDTLATAGIDAKFGLMFGGDGEDTLNLLGESNVLHDLIRGFELPAVDELVDGLVDDLPLVDHLGNLPIVDRLTGLPIVDRLTGIVGHVVPNGPLAGSLPVKDILHGPLSIVS